MLDQIMKMLASHESSSLRFEVKDGFLMIRFSMPHGKDSLAAFVSISQVLFPETEKLRAEMIQFSLEDIESDIDQKLND